MSKGSLRKPITRSSKSKRASVRSKEVATGPAHKPAPERKESIQAKLRKKFGSPPNGASAHSAQSASVTFANSASHVTGPVRQEVLRGFLGKRRNSVPQSDDEVEEENDDEASESGSDLDGGEPATQGTATATATRKKPPKIVKFGQIVFIPAPKAVFTVPVPFNITKNLATLVACGLVAVPEEDDVFSIPTNLTFEDLNSLVRTVLPGPFKAMGPFGGWILLVKVGATLQFLGISRPGGKWLFHCTAVAGADNMARKLLIAPTEAFSDSTLREWGVRKMVATLTAESARIGKRKREPETDDDSDESIAQPKKKLKGKAPIIPHSPTPTIPLYQPASPTPSAPSLPDWEDILAVHNALSPVSAVAASAPASPFISSAGTLSSAATAGQSGTTTPPIVISDSDSDEYHDASDEHVGTSPSYQAQAGPGPATQTTRRAGMRSSEREIAEFFQPLGAWAPDYTI